MRSLPIWGTRTRDDYLIMAAESLARAGDVASTRARLADWPNDRLAADLTRLQAELASANPVQAAEVQALSKVVGDGKALRSGSQASGTLTDTAGLQASVAVTAPVSAASPTPAPTPQSIDKTENILVLGIDTRPELEAWRTDSIMVVSIDMASGQVGIISIPRDLYVDIPGHGKDRINAAAYVGEKLEYPGGGPALVQRVVKESLGIPTQHWVLLKQEGLVKLVDALGGVTVNLDCPLYEETPDPHDPSAYLQFTLPAGKVLLNGADAKKFATYRYIQSDFGRVRRQQQLIWAIRNRALKGDVLPRIPELWTALSSTFTTDLNLIDIIRLSGVGIRLQPQNVHAMNLDKEVVMDYTTSEGWQVLALRSDEALKAKLAQLFAARALAEVGKAEAGGCPAPPPGFEDLTPAGSAASN